ncbi:MAG: hypothetical protein J2P37_05365 [Ktedonobacteraceae bacterium]|nr:hypothetical protein [Ktedonobacteraceae bacterium]
MKKRLFFISILMMLVVLVVAFWSLGFDLTKVGAIFSASKTPVGTLDGITSDGRLYGWALSKALPAQTISVHIYLDGAAGKGKYMGAVKANLPRADVNKALKVSGDHGFVWAVPPSVKGKHTFYVYAITPNWKAGMTNPQLQKSPLSVNIQQRKPIGKLESVTGDGVVRGWALAPLHPGQAVSVRVYVNGPAGKGKLLGTVKANLIRNDVNTSTGYAGDHGFRWYIPAKLEQYVKGKHTFYVYIVNPDGGTNPQLSSSPKSISTTYRLPSGYLDSASANGILTGWALAPRHPEQAVTVQVYVDGLISKGGKLIATLQANGSRDDINKTTGYSGNHGFSWLLPELYADGKHTFYLYVVDPDGGPRRLVGGAPKNLSSKSAKSYGQVDGISSDGKVTGWALSPEAPLQALTVYVYADGSASKGGKLIGTIQANQPSADANQESGYGGDHGFSWQLPGKYRLDKHTFYLYVFNPGWKHGIAKSLLRGSPVVFTGTPPEA